MKRMKFTQEFQSEGGSRGIERSADGKVRGYLY